MDMDRLYIEWGQTIDRMDMGGQTIDIVDMGGRL